MVLFWMCSPPDQNSDQMCFAALRFGADRVHRLVCLIIVVSCSGDLGSLPAVILNMICGVMTVPI